MSKEYRIWCKESGDWPELFYSLRHVDGDLEYLQDKHPDRKYIVYEREVGEWIATDYAADD